MKRTLIFIMVCGIICWMWLGLICLRGIPFDMISLYCATILASGITYSSGPIFFEFTVELVYPVPEGVVGGFLTVVYNTTGMIFLFLFYIPALRKYYGSIQSPKLANLIQRIYRLIENQICFFLYQRPLRIGFPTPL